MYIELNKKLLDSLKDLEIIDATRLEAAYKKSESEHLFLGDVLTEEGLILEENMGQVLADILGLPFVSLKNTIINKDSLAIITREIAQKDMIITFDEDDESVKVATYNPDNKIILSSIEKKTGKKVKVFFTTQSEIKTALFYYNKDLQETFDRLIGDDVTKNFHSPNDAPIAKVVDLLIEYAYQSRASDIHIEPWETFTLVRFRIDGKLHSVLKIPKVYHDNIVLKVKTLAKIKTDEHQIPQDGKIHIKINNENIDIRVSVVPVIKGEEVEFRLLTSNTEALSLNTIGLSDEDLEKVKRSFAKPFGMVLSTGPTGSGKTTTIYTIIKTINVEDNNIYSIEDPVEYNIEGMNQIQVNPQVELTFARGLRSILRQDPDIVFVGEIRDSETADIAINSAMTGHLVLSTLHTNNAAATIPRLVDMGIEPFLITSTINAVIGQKLVRRICDKCIYSEDMNISDLKKHFPKEVIEKHFDDKKTAKFYKGKGCQVCQFIGYRGRVGIFEFMELSKTIKELILQKADEEVINNQAMKDGMKSMFEDGLQKALNGLTSMEELIRVIKMS